MTRFKRMPGWMLGSILLLGACDLPPMVSDTGLRGTWVRRAGEGLSIVSITEIDGRWYVRSTRRSPDGTQSTRCEWDGRCQETLDGKLAATSTVTTTYDPDTATLTTDIAEERIYPSKKTIHLREDLLVDDHGRTLRIFTVDRGGQRFEHKGGPQRWLTKVADSVPDPPRSQRP